MEKKHHKDALEGYPSRASLWFERLNNRKIKDSCVFFLCNFVFH